jgi:transposase
MDSASLSKSKSAPSTPSPSTEVTEKASRRRYTAKYKLGILEKADACTEPGEVGALLRREGLYSSHLTMWRKARKTGSLDALAPKRRGPKPAAVDPDQILIAELQRELRRATLRAERAEAIVELQKKLSQLLGIPLPEPPDEASS